MYYNLLKSYISNLNKGDILDFSIKQGIKLTDHEVDVIYDNITNNFDDLYNGNTKDIFGEIKKEVRSEVYDKMITLYEEKRKLL